MMQPALKAHVMVIEDEAAIAEMIAYNLTHEGYRVSLVRDGDEAMPEILTSLPDLILLDWMLPGLSGIEICRQLRAHSETRSMPVIMLTARSQEADRIRGLETGADDYLTKPFSMAELTSRIKAVLRRSQSEDGSAILTIGDITLDHSRKRVTRGKRKIKLGPKEFSLLDVLMRRPGWVYSREKLLDLVWGQDVYVEDRTVDVHIGRLRKALNRGDEEDPLRTVRGSGYAFDEDYPRA